MFSALYQRTKNIANFLKPKRKFLAVFSLCFLVFGVVSFLPVSSVNAQVTCPDGSTVPAGGECGSAAPQAVKSKSDGDSNQANPNNPDPGFIITAVTWVMLFVSKVMLSIAMWAISFIIQVAGYNGYLNSVAVNVGWVMVRDVTNMFFVVILLLVAFGTILGLEQYEWKKMLVKFFFAAVLVNFSRTICGLIIDVGQVIMITFVNGIAATAGGNIINAFGLNNIYSLAAKTNADVTNTGEVFGTALAALVFSALTMAIMLVFVYMLVARLIVLWILIVLSPFAFVLSVIPQTEKYASQWWSEFGNHVVVGPAVVFFLWLSFAVVGGGNADQEIGDNSQVPPDKQNLTMGTVAPMAASMDWNNMANFAIGIGILLVGAKTAQSLGTVGGDSMSKATDFAKKTAMVASGAAAGLWAGQKAWEGTKAAGVGLAKGVYMATGVDDMVHKTKNWTQRNTVEAWKNWRSEGGQQIRYQKNSDGSDKIDPKTGMRMAEVDADGNIQFDENERKGVGASLQRYFYNRRSSVLRSDKSLEKVSKETELNEEIIKKRARSTPQHILQNFGITSLKDGDRVKQGILEAEEERSSAKTAEFKALGRDAVLKGDRFAYNKKTGKEELVRGGGTVAEQIAGHNVRAEATEAQIKNLFSQAKKSYLGTVNGKKALSAKVSADFKAEVADAASHLAEGGEKLHYMGSVAGRGDMMESTLIKAEEKKEHALTEELETRFSEAFEGSKEGKHIRKDVLRSEQAKLAMENSIKMMRGHDLEKAFAKAAEEMAKIIKTGGKGMKESLERAASGDAFIASLRSDTLLKEDERAEHLAKTKAEEKARAGWYEIPKLGYASPSQAMDQMIKETGERLKSLEAPDGGAMAAMQIAHILRLKKDGVAVSEEQQAALFSSVAHITKEAWTDDTIAEISALFKDLRDGNIKDEEKAANVEAMKDIFVRQLGLITENDDGSFSSVSNQENARALQNLVVTGGDVEMVKANEMIDKAIVEKEAQKEDQVEKIYKENEERVLQEQIKITAETGAEVEASEVAARLDVTLDKKKIADSIKIDYQSVAQELGANNTLGMTFDEFKTRLQKSQNLIQEGASTFKRAALDAGHVQMGGHQVYDRSMGMYRLNTLKGAMSWMVTELGKRKGVESAQIHSFGTINNENGKFTKVNIPLTRALTAGVTTARQASFLPRTVDKKSGYGIGEQEASHVEDGVSYGLIGGGKDYSRTAADRREFTQVILDDIEANSEAAKIVWAKKMKINNDDVDKGKVKFAFQLESGDVVKGDSYSKFLEDLKSKLPTLARSLNMSPEEVVRKNKILADAIATSMAKERSKTPSDRDS